MSGQTPPSGAQCEADGHVSTSAGGPDEDQKDGVHASHQEHQESGELEALEAGTDPGIVGVLE
jgi:hypothetical protein